MRRLAIAGVTAATLSACGSGAADTAAQEPNAAASSSTPNASQSTEAPAPAPDAMAILGQMQAEGLPITASLPITEANYPNNLIGRPGQYTSKVVFADERTGVAIDETAPSNDAGGSIEVFEDAQAAQGRSDYIQESLASLGPIAGTEYHYLSGTALVRVTGELVPTVATE